MSRFNIATLFITLLVALCTFRFVSAETKGPVITDKSKLFYMNKYICLLDENSLL